MKKLKLAVIGQGRSGRDIHGVYYHSQDNVYYDVAYVVERDPQRRDIAKKEYPECVVLSDYKELFEKEVDLVVNASFSDEHYSITQDLLAHGKNVLVEKPLARNLFECQMLEKTAVENGAILAIFQNTSRAPYYGHILQVVSEGKLGDIQQVNLRFNGFSRRWDWQTMKRKLGGNLYNMGPHALCIAMGILDYDSQTKVLYSKLAQTHTSGDAEDYVKILLTAPNKPLVDVEISSNDAYANYNVKIQGSKGTFKCSTTAYEYKYYTDEENPPKPLMEETLKKENGEPNYCAETLSFHEEKGEYSGTAFDVGTKNIYEDVYYAITEKQPLVVTPKMASAIVAIMEMVHAQNPSEMKY